MKATSIPALLRLNLRRKPRGYWSRFSVCLFVVLLAVFTWAVHRRLAQYDSVLQDGHHLASTKVCLPDRPQVTVSPQRTFHATPTLTATALFAFTLVNRPAEVPVFVNEALDTPPRSPQWVDCGLSRCSYLPPPSQISSL